MNPIPEKTIKAQCKDADGDYSTYVKKGVRHSACSYSTGTEICTDYYTNGVYSGEQCSRKVPTHGPIQQSPVGDPGQSSE